MNSGLAPNWDYQDDEIPGNKSESSVQPEGYIKDMPGVFAVKIKPLDLDIIFRGIFCWLPLASGLLSAPLSLCLAFISKPSQL